MDDDSPHGDAQTGLDHLRRAARELIAAARSVLDAAEELVEDPATVRAAVDSLRSVVTAVVDAASTAGRPGGPDTGSAAIERIDVE